jgi:hypothetical protein
LPEPSRNEASPTCTEDDIPPACDVNVMGMACVPVCSRPFEIASCVTVPALSHESPARTGLPEPIAAAWTRCEPLHLVTPPNSVSRALTARRISLGWSCDSSALALSPPSNDGC